MGDQVMEMLGAGGGLLGLEVADRPDVAVQPAVPIGAFRSVDMHAVFRKAFEAVACCDDVTCAAGSTAARAYAMGAAGSLRHAARLLACADDPATTSVASTGFETRKVGTSELIGGPAGWDTALRCRLADGRHVRAKALWPLTDVEHGIWMRVDAELPNLWCRGRLEVADSGLVFHDDPAGDVKPTARPTADLGRDLLTSGPRDLNLRPASAAALEISLVSGSWYHLATGRRWFADAATARAIVRALGGHVPLDSAMRARLAGIVDRGALVVIERLGWRHMPTPSIAEG